jgi:carotenoid cleavage dioxygenase
MSILDRSKSPPAEAADRNRRSFFWKLGAGVSAALASTAGLARAESGNADREELAIRKLHQAYELAMDKGSCEEVIGMFAEDAEVMFNGELFRHRSQVSRLYRERFPAGKIGRRMEPAPGFELDAAQQREIVEVSPDRLSAKAVFPYSIQVGAPLETETSLASMARLHGEGVRTWWEGGVYDVSYVKDPADSRWRISRLEYRTLSRADYRPGRSYARPISA